MKSLQMLALFALAFVLCDTDLFACGRLRERWKQRRAERAQTVEVVPENSPENEATPLKTTAVFGQVEKTTVPNYGLNLDRMSERERVTLNGREVPKHTVLNGLIAEARAQSAVPDDRALLSLTIVGKPEERSAALKGLQAPEFEKLRADTILQEYDPDDVMVSAQEWGGPINGHPSILLQKPDGKPLWGANDYRGKDTWMAFAKADPNFRLEDVPGLGKPATTSGTNLIPAFVVLGAGLAAVTLAALVLRKRV